MSRFINLELGGESEELDQSQPAGVVKDEAYYLREARDAFEQGDFEPALRHYSKVLEFNSKNVDAWSAQARMLIELNEYREAKVWADKALEIFPDHPELLAVKAVALARAGDLDTALAFSDAAMEQQGNTPYVWLARGDVLLARSEKRADYCFEKAMALAPHDWLIAWLAGRIRYFYKQFVVALGLFRQAAEANPSNYRLWLDLGYCQKNLSMVGLAEDSFRRALDLNRQCSAAELALTDLSQAGLWRRMRGFFRQ